MVRFLAFLLATFPLVTLGEAAGAAAPPSPPGKSARPASQPAGPSAAHRNIIRMVLDDSFLQSFREALPEEPLTRECRLATELDQRVRQIAEEFVDGAEDTVARLVEDGLSPREIQLATLDPAALRMRAVVDATLLMVRLCSPEGEPVREPPELLLRSGGVRDR